MSKAYKCDRCGAVFSTRDTGVTVGLMDKLAPTTIRCYPVKEKFYGFKRHLCSNCSAQMHEFLNGRGLDYEEDAE